MNHQRKHRRHTTAIILITCGDTTHRIRLPRSGPIVLFDHPPVPRDLSDIARGRGSDQCLRVLQMVRGRISYNGWGWYMWLVHRAPEFGAAGVVIRDRLREFEARRNVRRILRQAGIYG